MVAGERFAPLNFESLTKIKSFHAGVCAVLARPHRDLCDLSWVTDSQRDIHKLGDMIRVEGELTEAQLKVLSMCKSLRYESRCLRFAGCHRAAGAACEVDNSIDFYVREKCLNPSSPLTIHNTLSQMPCL